MLSRFNSFLVGILTRRVQVLLFCLFLVISGTAVAQQFATASIDISAATTTQIIAGSTGQGMNISNLVFTVAGNASGTSQTFQLVTGTVNGNACATNNAVLTGPLQANTSGLTTQFVVMNIAVPTSSAVCVKTTTVQPVGGFATFNRF